MELSSKYNPKETQDKWLKYWKDNNIFHAKADPSKKPFTIVIPPPNVTGILHMGHALNNTLQDILVRYKRMNGYEALWMPGTDHAGIATQNVVEKQLAKEGKTRQDLGREEFLKRLWSWKQEYGDTIINQLEKLGSSCDWPRTRFTMDDEYSQAVKEAFIHLYQKGLIYRGERIINWCPRCQTALSDEEAEHKEKNGKLYHLKYPFKDHPDQFIVVATTRPETMLGDVAVAVNPKDERYNDKIGKILILPLVNREIKIIRDDFVASEFGTGAVKVTPAHDPNDFMMGQRHHLPVINVMNPDASINENGGKYKGLDRYDARKRILADLELLGLLEKIEDHKNAVGHCYRCDTVVEPYLSKQWFVKMKPLAKPALEAVQKGEIKIHPAHWSKVYTNWMEEIHDWCISRQIWWGHRIPVWTLPLHGPWGIPKELEEYVKEVKIENDVVLKAVREGEVDTVYICSKTFKADLAIENLNAFYQMTTSKPFNPKLQEIFPSEKTKKLAEIVMGSMASDQVTQDTDVLDTWFSSWLWPFATLGWPQKNEDLNYFYPTNTLMTASEILFFWVARMIMAGYEFMGEKPFSDVLIHGTVRDAKGRKMSKSLGNAIDPLEIIDEYGADALRFSLIINSGQDIFISKEKFEIGRNFANKIWNAARLVLSHSLPLVGRVREGGDLNLNELDLPSRWIIARFYETLEKVSRAIEAFHYSEAEILIQDFFWGSYCDWYLELIKSKFNDPNIQKTSLFILKNSLKMMHPFIPFVTEEIYSMMNPEDKCLSLASWPKENGTLVDNNASKNMQMVIDIITAIRNIRAQWNIKPNEQVDSFIVSTDPLIHELLSQHADDFLRMARLKNLSFDYKSPVLSNAAIALVGTIKVFIPLEGLIDLNAEKRRMDGDIAQKRKSIDSLNARLNSPDFTSKAPGEIIAKEKERLEALNKEVIALEGVLANLL